MPSPQHYIGASVTAFVPNDERLLDLGYTDVRIFWASAENGPFTQEADIPLVGGQFDYFFNKPDAAQTDWWYWAPYGAVPGLGPGSEAMPVGPPRNSRLAVRQGVGRRLGIMQLAPVTTGTDADTLVCASLIDADASPAKFANKFARSVGGNVPGEVRRIRAAANGGYVPATGTLNFGNQFSATPTTSTVLEIWTPAKDSDPSAMVDEAMNRARRRLWWDESFLFTIDRNVTDYFMPASMIPGTVRSVDFAAGDYPERPGWAPVGFWDLSMDLGQPLMTVSRNAFLPSQSYEQGTIIRVRYNRIGDRMDDDDDYWGVPLEWAVAEVAFDYLNLIATPGGGREDVSDAATAKARVLEEALEWRRMFMPPAKVQMRLPQ